MCQVRDLGYYVMGWGYWVSYCYVDRPTVFRVDLLVYKDEGSKNVCNKWGSVIGWGSERELSRTQSGTWSLHMVCMFITQRGFTSTVCVFLLASILFYMFVWTTTHHCVHTGTWYFCIWVILCDVLRAVKDCIYYLTPINTYFFLADRKSVV